MWGMTSGALTGLGYPIVQHTLENGLRVISSPDHLAPSVAVNIWYDVGSRDEEEGRTGFAHLFEHVMFQARRTSVRQHIALLRRQWSYHWFDRTNYRETLPTGGDLACGGGGPDGHAAGFSLKKIWTLSARL
jgi:predicted Zn-dependent peptidase